MTDQPAPSSAVRRLVISEILIVILLGLSFAAFSALYANRPEVQEKQTNVVRLNVDVFKATPVDFQELLTGFGTVLADRETIMAAQVTGEIIDIHPNLKIGQAVSAGRMIPSPEGPTVQRDADLLLRIDPRDYQQRLDQTQSRIAETKTEIEQLKVQQTNISRQLDKARQVLKTLKAEYTRIQNGLKRRASTPTELNRALLEVQRYEDTIIKLETEADAFPHRLAAAEQRLMSSVSENEQALTALERTEVEPPFDGVLSEVFVDDGQYVRAGEAIARLTDLRTVEIPISLSFDDFLHLSKAMDEGKKPNVSLSENEKAAGRWKGQVVRTSPEADAASRTVQVFVEVTNKEDATPLLPGAFVHSRIDGPKYLQTIVIPREAIIDGAVFVVDEENIVQKRRIVTDRRLRSLVIVTDGLQPDDRVILTNLDIVEDGKEVFVQSVLTAKDELSQLTDSVVRITDESN